MYQGYTGGSYLITQYTPYFRREAHETLSKGGMTICRSWYRAYASHSTLSLSALMGFLYVCLKKGIAETKTQIVDVFKVLLKSAQIPCMQKKVILVLFC